jgi:hypothetical protein
VELYARVRRAVVVDKMSEREAAKQFGLARETVRKMLRYSVPPGYRRQQPVRRPKLDAWTGTIDQILEQDKAEGRKQVRVQKSTPKATSETSLLSVLMNIGDVQQTCSKVPRSTPDAASPVRDRGS